MKVTCVSDLHGFYPELAGGDLLIVAGDLTARDTHREYDVFDAWLACQPYKKKIFIAGNHDNLLIKEETKKYFVSGQSYRYEKFEYLCDSGTEFEGLKIWGTPWTPTFPGINKKCKAFTYDDETRFYDEKVLKIPPDIDILVTHGPAYGILDEIELEDGSAYPTGSTALQAWIKYVNRPKLHVFGHIHEAYGIKEEFLGYNDTYVKSINCSHVNAKYKPVNKPVDIIL